MLMSIVLFGMRLLEVMFFVGIAGSAIVVAIATAEDMRELFSKTKNIAMQKDARRLMLIAGIDCNTTCCSHLASQTPRHPHHDAEQPHRGSVDAPIHPLYTQPSTPGG